MRDHGLFPAVTGPAIAIYCDDPQAVPATELRPHAGMIVAPGTALPEALDHLSLPGGRFAVLTHRGPFDGLPAALGLALRPVAAAIG